MLASFFRKLKYGTRLLTLVALLCVAQPLWAAGPPSPSIFSNPLALALIILMLLLLIIIGILANLLIGSADMKRKKDKKPSMTPVVTMLLLLLLGSTHTVWAQDGDTTTSPATIGGMSATTFYIMVSAIFLELAIILILLVNIRLLLKQEKTEVSEEAPVLTLGEKRSRLSWWDKFNKLRPVTQEAELDLGHEYDGIRELNNRLPPWWLYGFYATILFAGIYLWRYHVSHSAPSSREEYERSVAKAELQVQDYLKKKGENIDENTVTYLNDNSDLAAGKTLFAQDGFCGTCHGKDGSGMVEGNPGVGPNLTDDYWIHGGSIKDIFSTIKYGVNGKGMPEWSSRLSAKEIAQVASFIKSIRGSNPPAQKTPDGKLYEEETPGDQKPAADSTRMPIDSIKTGDRKVALN